MEGKWSWGGWNNNSPRGAAYRGMCVAILSNIRANLHQMMPQTNNHDMNLSMLDEQTNKSPTQSPCGQRPAVYSIFAFFL
jgi:hypothetical protein